MFQDGLPAKKLINFARKQYEEKVHQNATKKLFDVSIEGEATTPAERTEKIVEYFILNNIHVGKKL